MTGGYRSPGRAARPYGRPEGGGVGPAACSPKGVESLYIFAAPGSLLARIVLFYISLQRKAYVLLIVLQNSTSK